MKHMLKVLLIAIVGLFVGNVKATTQAQQPAQPQTVFDLPPTEVYDLGEQIKVNGMLKCLLKNNYVIEFPLDGHQPTTEEAVKYSCANVDNGEDSPITEWYMKMFGIEPLSGNTYLEAGYTTENKTCKIINLACCDCYSLTETNLTAMNVVGSFSSSTSDEVKEEIKLRTNTFRTIFRQIASSSIGRIFLYRLLIEIRRKSVNDNEGITEDLDQMPNNEKFRNNARSVTVSYGFWEGRCINPHVQEWRYFPATLTESSKISITFDSVPIFIIQGKEMIRHLTTKKEIAALMFHEMLHWYQDLRAYQRTQNERVSISESGVSSQMTFQNCVQEWYNTIKYWIDEAYFRGDELRVICGNMNEDARNVLCGDDLSENAFRYFSNLPLRFGHSFRCEQSELCREILFSIFAAATDISP